MMFPVNCTIGIQTIYTQYNACNNNSSMLSVCISLKCAQISMVCGCGSSHLIVVFLILAVHLYFFSSSFSFCSLAHTSHAHFIFRMLMQFNNWTHFIAPDDINSDAAASVTTGVVYFIKITK